MSVLPVKKMLEIHDAMMINHKAFMDALAKIRLPQNSRDADDLEYHFKNVCNLVDEALVLAGTQ